MTEEHAEVETETDTDNETQTQVREKRFPVVEIFGPTIQGEGNVLGMRTMFVRFGGCDYRCTKCDSLHAVLPELVKRNAQYLTTQDILENLARVEGTSEVPPMVTFSGGNPCMHKLDDLVDALNEHGVAIAVETQGTIWRDWLLKCAYVTVSPKGPGMGETFERDKFDRFIGNLRYHEVVMGRDSIAWCVKVVIQDQRDIEFAKDILESWPEIGYRGKMYLSLGNPMPPVPDTHGETQLLSSVGLTNKYGQLINDPAPSDLADFRNSLLNNYAILVAEVLREPMLRNCIVTPQFHVLLWGNKQGV